MNAILKLFSRDFWKRPSTKAFCIFTALFAVLSAATFWGAWSLDLTAVMPDHNTVHPQNKIAVFLASIWNGGACCPSDLHWFAGSPYFWNELEYAIPCFMAAMAAAFYLRGLGFGLLSRYAGALFYGFSGYLVTLFSAGHMGWFLLITYLPFVFGLTDRLVRKNKLRNWIFLGAVCAWGSIQQPDIWLIHMFLAAAYAIYSFTVYSMKQKSNPAYWRKQVPLRLGGLCIAALVFTATGFPQLKSSMTESTSTREKQIAESVKGQISGGITDEDKYAFATTWSMPPEDMLEFVAPDVYGGSSDPQVTNTASSMIPNYWGRLGDMRNSPIGMRQHTLYIGGIVLAFALLGFLGAFTKEGRSRDLAFWICAVPVILFCSLGGFTPFYKLVSKLPFMDIMRCPVKFHHLLEFAIAVVAAHGVRFFCESGAAAKKSKLAAAAISGVCAAALLVFASRAEDMQPAALAGDIASRMSQAGNKQAVSAAISSQFPLPLMKAQMASAARHGAAMLTIAALALLLAASKNSTRKLPGSAVTLSSALAALLAAASAIDSTTVNHRYLGVKDISLARRTNDAAATMISSGGGKIFNAGIFNVERAGSSWRRGVWNGIACSSITESFHVYDKLETSDDPRDPAINFIFMPVSFGKTAQFQQLLNFMGLGNQRPAVLGRYAVSRDNGIVSLPDAMNNDSSWLLLQVRKTPDGKHESKDDTPPAARIASLLSAAATLGVLALALYSILRERRTVS